jgi:glutamate-1-semialdehyde 2,1-aminomutase
MSKFPEYKHTKSHEYFDRAIKVIPSGIYGHLGPAEGLWVPVSMAFLFRKSKGYIFLGR